MDQSNDILKREVAEAEVSEDKRRLEEVCRRALNCPTIQGSPKEVFWFGIKLAAHFLLIEPDERKNIDEGISVLEKMLLFITRENRPKAWAVTQCQLGGAFYSLARLENKPEDLIKALPYCENALSVLTAKDSPKEWALATIMAAEAYWHGEENRLRAVSYLNEALKVYTEDEFPEEFADYSKELTSWNEVIAIRVRLLNKGIFKHFDEAATKEV